MTAPDQIPVRPLFTATLSTTRGYDVVPHPGGPRHSVCFFTEGQVEGDRLSAQVVAGGGDWAVFRTDDSFDIDVRAILQTPEGHIVDWRYWGVWCARPGAIARVFGPDGIATYRAEDHYVRVFSRFRTDAAPLLWLNDVLALGYGRPLSDTAVGYTFHQVL